MSEPATERRFPRLIGRRAECRVLDDLLESVRRERSRALVLLGEAGVGKSALLDHVGRRADATQMQVVRVAGIEAEVGLGFAGLHQALGGMDALIGDLPGPQRTALRVAFGAEEGGSPDALGIAVGALGVLSAQAAGRPLVCLVDDAQWLDRESLQALSFVARRLEVEPVGFVFASREPLLDLGGLESLDVRGLALRDALALLDSSLSGPLDRAVRTQIVGETSGNPLALIELSRRANPAELAGGFALPGATTLSVQIEESYRRRLYGLPDVTQQLLLLAAADPVGDPSVFHSAVQQLGLGDDALFPAVDAGLLTVGARVQFAHPLARSGIYRAADSEARRRAHRALAKAMDGEHDPDRRAWHRAKAAVGPDEDTAQDLEQSARRARSRGGVAASAAFLERAASLTPSPGTRARRLLAAAELAQEAGALERALWLLDTAETGALDDDQTARSTLLRGQIALGQHRGPDAVALLAEAARDLQRHHLPKARATVLEAVMAAMWIAGPPDDVAQVTAVTSVTSVTSDGSPEAYPSTTDLIIEGMRSRIVDDFRLAAPALERALDAVVSDTVAHEPQAVQLATLWATLSLPIDLWNEPAWRFLVCSHLAAVRREGALTVLSASLSLVAIHRIFVGDLEAARLVLEEGRSIALSTGGATYPQIEALVNAWSGDEDRTAELRDQVTRSTEPGLGRLDMLFVDYAEVVVHNARGHFDKALRLAAPLFEADHYPMGPLIVSELVDAASRAGATDLLAAAESWIELRADAAPTPWCLGVAERVRALVSEGDLARRHYASSIEHLGRLHGRTELARSHLMFGEWLRRHGQRADARRHLRSAEQLFQTMGAVGFAERSAQELRALGDHSTLKASPERILTAQETLVAELASSGLTNPEIAGRLFLSPRTVQYHLRKVFIKLDISSRVQLRSLVGGGIVPPPERNN